MDVDGALLTPILAGLARRLADHGLTAQAAALDRLPAAAGSPGSGGTDEPPPVLDHLAGALALAADGGAADLAAAVGTVAATAPWTRTAAYVADPPGPDFLARYAHATLAGPADGAGEPAADGVALGLLLLGPDVLYPPHHHPADEVYLPLTPAAWLDTPTGTYARREPGAPVHHRPWQPHGMRTAAQPLLAVYLWTGDVVTSSRFCGSG